MRPVQGDREFTVPFGVGHACHGGLLAQRYFYEHGATLGQCGTDRPRRPGECRVNPDAVYREPLTMDDYLGARMISEPLCLYDCDPPVDGSVAVVVSRREAAPATGHPPVLLEAVGSTPGIDAAGSMLWARSPRLAPGDVDIAEVYDGWSILSLLWLESLGLCGRGEAAKFIEGGWRSPAMASSPSTRGGGQPFRRPPARVHPAVRSLPATAWRRGSTTR